MKIKEIAPARTGAETLGVNDEKSLFIHASILQQKPRKRKIKLLREVLDQASWLAETHRIPEVRQKHRQIAETCRRRITELNLRSGRAA